MPPPMLTNSKRMPGRPRELGDKAEQHLDRRDHVLVVALVGDDHRVQAEAGGAALAGAHVGVDDLVVAQAVLRLFRLADDRVAGAAAAGVVAEADQLRHARQLVDEADVVQVEDAAAVRRSASAYSAGEVLFEVNIMSSALGADRARHLQLGDRAAVEAEAQLARTISRMRRLGSALTA